MNLYEVTNGYMGESYVRVYVWCKDEETALQMAGQAFESEGRSDKYSKYTEDYWTTMKANYLFSADDIPFVTQPSGAGWVNVGGPLLGA